MVIKPVGGVSLDTQVGLNCDSVLRSQLVFQRGASTADRMQVVISQIQSQQQDCAKDVWDPDVINLGVATTGTGAIAAGDPDDGMCFKSDGGFTKGVALATDIKVGDQGFPSGLARIATDKSYYPRTTSGRDSENNILVYWADDVAKRPSDAASCWLYFARLRSWHENFVQ